MVAIGHSLKMERMVIFRNFICASQDENLILAPRRPTEIVNCEMEWDGHSVLSIRASDRERAECSQRLWARLPHQESLLTQNALATLPSSVPFMMETQSSPTRKGDALNTSFT